jgi:sugar phosphate isomerase/epimerase
VSADPELLAAYWVGSGPLERGRREWSHFDWRERCAQCAAAGFDGIGLYHADLGHQLEFRSLAEIRSIFDDAGLTHLELSYLSLADGLAEPGGGRRREAERRTDLLLEAAAALEARHVKVVSVGPRREPGRLTEAFADLCRRAEGLTDALFVYEFVPPGLDPNVTTFEQAVSLVGDAGHPNGRLLLDTWHLSKAGVEPGALGAVAIGSIGWVELSDGVFHHPATILEEVSAHRSLVGEGEFDIPAYLEAFRRCGYTGPYGVEICSAELEAMPIEEQYRVTYATTMSQFGSSPEPLAT